MRWGEIFLELILGDGVASGLLPPGWDGYPFPAEATGHPRRAQPPGEHGFPGESLQVLWVVRSRSGEWGGEDCPSLTSFQAWLPSVHPLLLWPRQPPDTGRAGGNYPGALITPQGCSEPQIAQQLSLAQGVGEEEGPLFIFLNNFLYLGHQFISLYTSPNIPKKKLLGRIFFFNIHVKLQTD